MKNNIATMARIGGVLYVIIIAGGIFAEAYVRNRLVVPGDIAATAATILANEGLWRVGIATNMVMLMCAVPLAMILYVLLRPVNRPLALLAAFFNLVSIAIEALGNLNLVSALHLVEGSNYLSAFEPQQLQGLAYLSIQLHGACYNISLVFFGLNCLFWGILIYRSRFFPRIIGLLLVLCAICYVVNSFSWLLAPGLAATLFPVILLPCLVAELALCLWLLVKGVDVVQWEQAVAQA